MNSDLKSCVNEANIHDSNKLRELIDETDDELHTDSADYLGNWTYEFDL